MNVVNLSKATVDDIAFLRSRDSEDGKAMVEKIDQLIYSFIEQSAYIPPENDKEAHQMLDRIRFMSDVKDIIYNLSKEE